MENKRRQFVPIYERDLVFLFPAHGWILIVFAKLNWNVVLEQFGIWLFFVLVVVDILLEISF